MSQLFWLFDRYELLNIGFPNSLWTNYSDSLISLIPWYIDFLIYLISWFFWFSDLSDCLIVLIVWFPNFLISLFVWLSDSSDCLISWFPDLSDCLIVWFFWLSDCLILLILLILLISANRQISNQKNSSPAILAVYYSNLQWSSPSFNQLFYVQHISIYQNYRKSGIVFIRCIRYTGGLLQCLFRSTTLTAGQW